MLCSALEVILVPEGRSPIGLPALACARRVAGLHLCECYVRSVGRSECEEGKVETDHEPWDEPVEDAVIVFALSGEHEEVVTRFGRLRRI